MQVTKIYIYLSGSNMSIKTPKHCVNSTMSTLNTKYIYTTCKRHDVYSKTSNTNTQQCKS